jgi:hypothetical protein
MKRILLAAIAMSTSMLSLAQTDTTKREKIDTIKVGGMIIIKKSDGDGHDTIRNRNRTITISNNRNNVKRTNSNLRTNWWIVDLGFSNFNDKTNYAAAQASGFVAPGVGEDQLELRTGKSVNVNIWFFMQRLNMVKNVVNLKYGLGLELNNYRFDDERVYFQENPTRIVLNEDYKGAKKNKLAADYVTVPVMLNLNFTPGRKNGFLVSGGVSAGYLYSSRQKFKVGDNKDKNHDDFDLRKWKLAYIGELGLGPVRLYGSYAMKSMWEKGLDQTPYNVGIRISSF